MIMEFKIASWNIISIRRRKKEVLQLIREENTHVCGVLETNVKPKRIEVVS